MTSLLSGKLKQLEATWSKLEKPQPGQKFSYDMTKAILTILDEFLTNQLKVQEAGGTPFGPGKVADRMNSMYAEVLAIVATMGTAPGEDSTKIYMHMVEDFTDAASTRMASAAALAAFDSSNKNGSNNPVDLLTPI